MDQELASALVEVINMAVSAKDFVVSETPDVLKQLLAWKFWENFAYFWAAVLLIIFTAWAVPKTIKICIEDEDKKDFIDRYSPIVGVNMFWVLMIIPIGCLMNITWLQIWIAPKIFLIEYAASLVK